MFNHLKSGGAFVKTREFIWTYDYSEEETDAAQIIQNSFKAFLKKELQRISEYVDSIV